MNILIDCDNILNNLCEVVLNQYNKDYNDNLTISDITKYHIENFVKPTAKDNFYQYFTKKEIWKQISVIPDSQYFIGRLRADGHRLYLCTKTEPYNAFKKSRWCERNFGFNPRKDFLCVPDKKMIKADILIDDCIDNFGGQTHSIILDYPWNRNMGGRTDIIRANNWKEIYEIIYNIKNY